LWSLDAGDVLTVWRLDRVRRSLPHLLEVVADLKARGVGFQSPNETIDTTMENGELIFHLFASMAQFECSLIVERTQAGLCSRKKALGTSGATSCAQSGTNKTCPKVY